MSSELSDGCSASVVDADDEGRQVVLDAVRTFLDEFADKRSGSVAHCEIEIVEMSDEKFRTLPEL